MSGKYPKIVTVTGIQCILNEPPHVTVLHKGTLETALRYAAGIQGSFPYSIKSVTVEPDHGETFEANIEFNVTFYPNELEWLKFSLNGSEQANGT